MFIWELSAYFINADKRYGRNSIVKNLITSDFLDAISVESFDMIGVTLPQV